MKKPFLILAAAAAGAWQALPEAFDLAGAIASAGQGDLGGSWTDRLVAAAVQAGGWRLAELARASLAAAPWFLGFLVLFFVVEKVPVRWRRAARVLVWLGWWATTFLGAWNGWIAWRDRIGDPRLLAPVALIEAAQAQSHRVFINPSALPVVAAWAPGLVDRGLSQEARSRLLQSPVSWREEDRNHPFSAVLLSGRLSEAKTLIQHLLDSPDWHLAVVDNQGMLFFRGGEPDRAEAEIPSFASARDRAIYLAQYALCLDAAGFKIPATQRLNEAWDLAKTDFEVLIRAASLAASRSRWEQARKLAGKAREKRPGNFEADCLLAWSLLETQAFDQAFEMTSGLAGEYPNDPSVLLLHARACRASKNFSAETASLEQLLRLAGDNKVASRRIHIYLGQSWIQRGFPDQALTHYRLALEGTPTPGESRDIRAAIETIEAGRLPTSP